MIFDIVTLFPEIFTGVFDASIIKKAQQKELIHINLHNLRDYAQDKHKQVDDTPYGGGAGMVLKVDVMDRCLESIVGADPCVRPGDIDPCVRPGSSHVNSRNKSGKHMGLPLRKTRRILLTPQGKTFNQATARRLSKYDQLILVCGHYEGFDERIREHLVDEQISIGNYVLTGGEIPAMILVDSISRLVPGVIKTDSASGESFSLRLNKSGRTPNLLEYPQYTKPAEYQGWRIPDILLSGHHAKIEKWRKDQIKKKK